MSTNKPPLDKNEEKIQQMTRRSLLTGGVAALAGVSAFAWIGSRPTVDGAPGPLRSNLERNARLSQAYYREARLAPEFPRETAENLRVNGDIGLDDDDFDPAKWKLEVDGLEGGHAVFTLEQIKSLPKVEFTTDFKCVEGWSSRAHWGGARLADFMQRYRPVATGDDAYVALVTPDEDYYVGLDMATAKHSQTLLCYELNGEALSLEHGAPLRLITPLKYGIKNLKRIGTMTFTKQRPADYWAERGYDYYAGF